MFESFLTGLLIIALLFIAGCPVYYGVFCNSSFLQSIDVIIVRLLQLAFDDRVSIFSPP